ncbi:MAG: SDR family oxidoreductase [Phycisphaerales bacterium]|nr:SDR family oxidoreductase [Phycisphaerales bacterium]
MNTDLTGKRALVCGGSKGIGLACAHELASLGATITLLARDAEAMKLACASLPTPKSQSHAYLVADFYNSNALKNTIDDAIKKSQRYEILINNTGGPPGGQAVDARPDEFARAFEAHLLCNQVLTQALLPGMKAAGFGRIINIISTSVKAPIPGLGVSNTIRGAVANWAKTISIELAPFNITVNNVLPGFTDTERLSSLISTRAGKQGATENEVADLMRASVPMGRFAKPEEIAAAVAFLASPAASYISGINLPVDGGRLPTL